MGTMRSSGFRQFLKLYTDAYASCLAACGNRYEPSLPAVRRLTRLSAELDAMHGALVLSQPDRMIHFLHGLDDVRILLGLVMSFLTENNHDCRTLVHLPLPPRWLSIAPNYKLASCPTLVAQ